MKKARTTYLDIIYSQKRAPASNYPMRLTKYLYDRYKLKSKTNLLDVGCGRGDFAMSFVRNGLKVCAVDQSDACSNLYQDIEFKTTDIENQGIPYLDDTFDVVFSKSVIEHFYNPDSLVKEIYRVLKPGGLAITLCPAWEYNYKIYFEDYTHRSPFMRKSLQDIYLINGYENVKVEFFRQLPSIWKNKWLILFSELTRLIVPNRFYSSESSSIINKWVRFSKEIMLLSSSTKPEL